MTRQLRVPALLVAVVVGATACTDATAPRLAGIQPGQSVTTEVGLPSGLQWGVIRLCKTMVGSQSGSFTFNVKAYGVIPSPNANHDQTVGLISDVNHTLPFGLNNALCKDVYASGKGGQGLDSVVIVENTPPQDWSLTALDIRQIMANTVYAPPGNGMNDVDALTSRTALVFINDDMARIVTFTNTYTPPPAANEGCTPGYWKQRHHADSWPAPYVFGHPSGTNFNDAFGVANPNALYGANVTLLYALDWNGGGKAALARHAAAALLNAASGFYPLTVAQVQAALAAAIANPTLINSTKNFFAGYNELGCPLN